MTKLYALERHSFSDEAARAYAASHPDMSVENVSTIHDVFNGVMERGALGLVPNENSSDGIVWPHLDRLSTAPVHIVGEVRHRVRMCLGGVSSASLSEICHIHSHSKALGQCSEFTSSLENVQLHSMNSTAAAAVKVASMNDVNHGVLSSRSAIDKNGLFLLADDVANLKGDKNITQFFVVRRNGTDVRPDPNARYHALFLTPKESDREGVLADILSVIAQARANLTSLHSRNLEEKKYMFFLEMERRGTAHKFESLVNKLNSEERHNLATEYIVRLLRWLGVINPAIGDSIHPPRWLGSWNEKVISG